MMVTGFLRVLASGVLLLLVTTTVFVQRADATTSATPTDGSGTTSSTGSDATPTDGTTGTTGTTGSDATPTDSTTGTTGSDATPTDSTTDTTGTTGSDATPTDSTTGTTGSDATPTDSTTDTTGTDAAPTDGTGTTGSDTSPTDGTDDDCSAELAACTADDTCSSCISADTTTEFTTCADEYEENSFATSTVDCANIIGTWCCYDEASDLDCVDNVAFGVLALCTAGDCADDERTCEDILNEVRASDGATASFGGTCTALAFSFAFMVLLPLLSV